MALRFLAFLLGRLIELRAELLLGLAAMPDLQLAQLVGDAWPRHANVRMKLAGSVIFFLMGVGPHPHALLRASRDGLAEALAKAGLAAAALESSAAAAWWMV